MSSAELNRKKLDLIDWISRLSDESVIDFLHGLKKSKTKIDWWENLTDHQQKMLLQGLEEAENGNTISASMFWKELQNEYEK